MLTPSEQALEGLKSLFLGVYPPHLVPVAEEELRRLQLPTMRLSLEVLEAEREQISYSDAVDQPQRFPQMSRVHYCVWDLLRTEIPSEMIDVFGGLLDRAASGEFEPWHRVLFEVGRRDNDGVAALFRFALWQAIRLNLLVASWETPACQALGLLKEEEEASEVMLQELLSLEADVIEDTRPLHIMVAEAMARTDIKLRERVEEIAAGYGGDFERLLDHIDMLEIARSLGARDAVIVDPGAAFKDQQIVDTYPQGALRTARSRLRRGLRRVPNPRFIDLVKEVEA